MSDMDSNVSVIAFVERNDRGAWVIYGKLGVRHYYYYTKDDAIMKYEAEYAAKMKTNK